MLNKKALNKSTVALVGALAISLSSTTALSASDNELSSIRADIQQMKEFYESKINKLERKLSKLETKQVETSKKVAKVKSDLPDLVAESNQVADVSGRNVYDNSFNPSIGLVLNGQYATRSEDFGEITGFAIGEEGEALEEGFGLSLIHISEPTRPY